MDYSLVDEARREKDLSDKGSFTTHNNDGRIFKRQDTDIALLMLYGHILYAGTSYAYALSMYLSISNSTWIVKC
jgi:general transcription factor 3C polypeptide 3 (transcription factor C subunit 4)